MDRRRTIALTVAAAAPATLLAGSLAAAAHAAPTASEATASQARPPLQVPFRCGEAWPVKTYSDHTPNRLAVDFNIAGSSDAGRPVLASASGKVIGVSKKSTSYGHAVEIDHGNGWRSFYAHLQKDSIAVSVGQQVSPITQVGRVGSTGKSTGPHLHYEQRQVVDGRSVLRPVILNGHAFNYEKTGTQTFTRPC
ncbi:murein DD-endopeptidase MepM/ murein hydrolase activator NlpD [Aeromicrobium sp. SORGH_AS981]|uniref:M23 family metallopeptidase n=1 Tax=Aeromicrobium sp. SORGH_AS_0981 TaxID=3041802 RepID=UPI00285A1E86|nr:M23 family metallopeptidase [Aeromicrobium sp. SORGH_AS_0981]MDR6117393.1 murein DD-endopeptidase MepM/ murein hydrolase activator NlpD [Aeromicrobium sp. SORGH_AS_0981]